MKLSSNPPHINLFSKKTSRFFYNAKALSRRTPDLATHLNHADDIERGLQQAHHNTWGLVIYRCTYASDADWSEFMTRLRYQLHAALDYYNGLDLLDKFRLTVFEDKDTLDGASKSAVRDRFRAWTVDALVAEQGAEAAVSAAAIAAAKQHQGEGWWEGLGTPSPRFLFCMHVDEDALESVVRHARTPPLPEGYGPGFVNLIARDWQRPNDDVATEPMEPDAESIDGLECHDVGWMKVDYSAVMVGFYVLLHDMRDWYREYRRPPEIVRA